MNKSTINVLSAGTKADSITTAQNTSVSQPNANTNVGRSCRQYKVIYVSGIAAKIGFEKSPNYYECVLETIYPTDEEIDKMSNKQQGLWTDENNSRMESICKFLNSKYESI